MPGLTILSPINEADELSPYHARFRYARYPGHSPMGTKDLLSNVQDTLAAKFPETSMDDLWIYDCYGSDDTTSPPSYSHSPSTPSHNRSISLPVTTANYIPPNDIPLIKEPTPSHRPPALNVLPLRGTPQNPMFDFDYDPTDILAYKGVRLPDIDTAVLTSPEFPEYSPLEQEVLSCGEVINQLAAAADQFSGVESTLSYAATVAAPDQSSDMDEGLVFSVIETLNLLVSDCTAVVTDLAKFSQRVQVILSNTHDSVYPAMQVLPRASFSEKDTEVLASAVNIPQGEVAAALAALETSVPPVREGKEWPRDRPPSLTLSTNDAVLLQARLPRTRKQSVGAVGRFADLLAPEDAQADIKDAMLRKHRAYVIIGEETPIDDNWSAKSIVDYDTEQSPPRGDGQQSQSPLSPRSPSEQSASSRPRSSPLTLAGISTIRRPPSLRLSGSTSPSTRSTQSTSSPVSSLFSSLPRSSSFMTTPSPRISSFAFNKSDLKARFPTSTGNIKKMFSNMFKKKERDGSGSWSSLGRLGRRTEAAGSIDATLSALSLGNGNERDPFAATPPLSAPLRAPPSADLSALDGYSSMFNPLKAASRFPSQPLFGGVEEP